MTELSIDPDDDQNHKGCHADWPQAVRELAGSWQEFPQQEELRAGQGEDIPRQSL
jgi:hypothetical protein